MNYKIFIATSVDGYIARRDGSIDWLTSFENQAEKSHEKTTLADTDYGYRSFFDSVDAIFMGRKTLETVLTFAEWPYGDKPLYVMSNTIVNGAMSLPPSITILNGSIEQALSVLEHRQHQSIFVDGGQLIQSMLRIQRMNEMIITQLPILLGDGLHLFENCTTSDIYLTLLKSQAYPTGFVQFHYCVNPARYAE